MKKKPSLISRVIVSFPMVGIFGALKKEIGRTWDLILKSGLMLYFLMLPALLLGGIRNLARKKRKRA